jgi:hypothetical protein
MKEPLGQAARDSSKAPLRDAAVAPFRICIFFALSAQAQPAKGNTAPRHFDERTR